MSGALPTPTPQGPVSRLWGEKGRPGGLRSTSLEAGQGKLLCILGLRQENEPLQEEIGSLYIALCV